MSLLNKRILGAVIIFMIGAILPGLPIIVTYVMGKLPKGVGVAFLPLWVFIMNPIVAIMIAIMFFKMSARENPRKVFIRALITILIFTIISVIGMYNLS